MGARMKTQLPKEVEEQLEAIEKDGELLPSEAAVLHETVRYEGIRVLERDGYALLLSALAAGFAMGAGFIAKSVIAMHIEDPNLSFLVSGFGYTLGYVIIILSNQMLFTENTLTAVLPFMSHPSKRTLYRIMRLWVIVLCGNLLGVVAFTLSLIYLPDFSVDVRAHLPALGHHIMENSPYQMLVKGVFAGWLMAALVWMLPNLGDNKIWGIIFITYIIALGEFTHIIAGSSEVLYLVFTGHEHWSHYFYPFAIPTLIGNIFGGTILFGLICHGEIRSDMPNNRF
ncbi:Inner membrane protein yfdC [Wohlfahrtiimonas chitiniclastica SH04]|uniref:Inner membrane protein yfdC n=2 Tax=Wohlfahrtiimonas chitiniclastica TaxID=400946 RepID=L8XVV6_9GAMM|nr:Inner membrane protein yfdC [Wohlfahrtiimonas chitiniclastica SH04]